MPNINKMVKEMEERVNQLAQRAKASGYAWRSIASPEGSKSYVTRAKDPEGHICTLLCARIDVGDGTGHFVGVLTLIVPEGMVMVKPSETLAKLLFECATRATN